MSTKQLTPLSHGAAHHCFGCGKANRSGLRLKFFVDDQQMVLCSVRLARRFEGPPGYAHGGIIATLLDEGMSKAVRARGLTAMTRHLEVDYRRPVPLCKPIRVEGRTVRDEGRKHWVEATIFDGDGHPLAHGKGLFVEVEPATLNRMKQTQS
jgi:uncharacterized protein (TIGR00369 family)